MANADAQIMVELVSDLLTDVDIRPGNTINTQEILRAIIRDYSNGIPSSLAATPERLSTLIEQAMQEIGRRDANKNQGFRFGKAHGGRETLTCFDIRPATVGKPQVSFAGSPSYYRICSSPASLPGPDHENSL